MARKTKPDRCEIRIRGVDPAAVSKIKTLAEKKNMSISAYLRSYVETLSVLDEIRSTEDKYSNLVLAISEAIQANTQTLNELIKEIREKEGAPWPRK